MRSEKQGPTSLIHCFRQQPVGSFNVKFECLTLILHIFSSSSQTGHNGSNNFCRSRGGEEKEPILFYTPGITFKLLRFCLVIVNLNEEKIVNGKGKREPIEEERNRDG